MKKTPIFSLALALAFAPSLALAQPYTVDTIPTKDSQFENTVTTTEFNTIVRTLRGIYNFFTEERAQLGINEPNPAQNLTLDIGGKVGAESYCDANGEHCIDPTTWDARPQLELHPAGASCNLRYRVKDSKYESEWQITGTAGDPVGQIAKFNSGLLNNCQGEGCGVQMAIQCVPNLAVIQDAACRVRYRVNHLKQTQLTPWTTTEFTTGDQWQEGNWSTVTADGGWGDGLNLQAAIECQDPKLRCQIGYRIHNEVESPEWKLSKLTDGSDWQGAEPSQLSADIIRACDQREGCGLQMQSRCAGTTAVLQTPLYSCPLVKEDRCASLCNGQISLDDKCSYQKLGGNNTCNVILSENCTPIGHLVQ